MLKKKLSKKLPPKSASSFDVYNVLSTQCPRDITEAYRKLYANITYLPIEDKCRKIAVTSATKGEGKTTVSVNLAVTLAQNLNKSKVLLVDCDLRNPSVARMLSKDFQPNGLSEFLSGTDKTPNIVTSSVDGLSVLYSGGFSDNPTRLISSEKMAKLFRLCEDKYDYIIFDTPALEGSAEAMLLKKYVSGYLLVAKARNSDVDSLSSAIESLKTVNANVFGVVLNGEDIKTK